MSYHKELRKLCQTRNIISLLPERVRYRIAKSLYNYESPGIQGIDLVTPMQGDGLVCFINTKDLIGWKIFFFGEYEAATNEILSKYVKEGDIIIEAGSNIGTETILLSKLVGNAGHVYAFEPNPDVYQRLKINLSINDSKNVDAYEQAIGETDTEISFNIFPKNFCNSGMSSKYVATPLTRKITVPQQTLDTFIAENNIKKVDFIKMDIQGAEMDLLQGASKTIGQFKPKIFVEAYNDFNDTKQLYEKLKEYGYMIYYISDERAKIMESVTAIIEGNWLAVQEKI